MTDLERKAKEMRDALDAIELALQGIERGENLLKCCGPVRATI